MSRHILITVTHVIRFGQDRQGKPQTEIAMLPKPLVMALPLDQIAITKAGDTEFAEVQYIFRADMSWRCAERFDDVIIAIGEVGNWGGLAPLIRVPLIEKIEAAVAQSFPMPQTAGEIMGKVKWGDLRPRNMSEARAGDLRIVDNSMGGYWVERYVVVAEGVMEWNRDLTPIEIRASYAKKQSAVEAIRIAGYIRLLVDDEDEQG